MDEEVSIINHTEYFYGKIILYVLQKKKNVQYVFIFLFILSTLF